MMPYIDGSPLLQSEVARDDEAMMPVAGADSRNPLIDATLTGDESGCRSDEHEIQDDGDSRDLSEEERHVSHRENLFSQVQ